MIAAPDHPREQSLAFLREQFVAMAGYADAGAAFTDAADTAGLSYTVAKLIAYLKVTASTTRELINADQERQAA